MKDYIIENKEDILLKASEIPTIIFETLDEIRSYSNNKYVNNDRVKDLEKQLSKQKYLNRVFGLGIIVVIAIIVIVT